MVLLPAIARDSIVTVIRSLVNGELDSAHLCLVGAIVISLGLPITTLGLLLRDLTRFYFHAQHFHHEGSELFTPRFTLTALRLPTDELRAPSAELLADTRLDPHTIELLVPPKDSSRRHIDIQLNAYGGLGIDADPSDRGRAAGLFELAASRQRPLLEEVAKVEHGMARHMLRLQVIVLRYVKALLAFLTTALAMYVAAAIVTSSPVTTAQELGLIVVVTVWAPCILSVVSAPVRWLDQLLRAEGAVRTGVAADPEFTQVERIATWLASAAWLLGIGALLAVLSDGDVKRSAALSTIVAVAASGTALGWQLVRWTRRRRVPIARATQLRRVM
jgi:hypothetical protein